jgi:outer membrane immunogenic protein
MMSRTLFALVALVATPAMAADLPAPAPAPYKAPPPVVYIYSWTGCYVGGHAGGLWAKKDWYDRDPLNLFGTFGQFDGSDSPSGFLGGVQAGCDYQFAGGFVAGFAADYARTNAQGSHASVIPQFAGAVGYSKVKSVASATVRLGYAWDRFLGYVKGGGAWENDDYSVIDIAPFPPGAASQSRSGWTVGVGGEYAFTNFLTGFVEYDYFDFGNRNVTLTFTDGTLYTYGIKETKQVLKAGLNLRWGAGPVVAKY